MIRYISLKEQRLLEWVEDINANDDLYDELKVMYEWEYKYNTLKQGFTARNEKRLQKVLDLIERKLNPILNSIIEKLSEVFKDWIDGHALTDPNLWAKKRIANTVEREGFDPPYILEGIKAEYGRYSNYEKNFYSEAFKASYLAFEDILNDLKDRTIEDIQYSLEQSEEEGDEDDSEQYKLDLEYHENLNLKDYEEASNFIETYYGDYKTFIESYADEDILIDIQEKLVFPVWYKYWKMQGIDKTKKRIEGTYKDLIHSEHEKDLSKKIMYINIALNESHQTGSMRQYIESMWDVSEKQLEDLSNIDKKTLEDWNKEVGMNL